MATGTSRPAARRRTGARSVTLTPESIVDKALEVLERDDTFSLSMRRLGDEMGVDPTAFYRHFRDKDDLVLAVWDRVMGEQVELLHQQPADLGWRERLKTLALNAWTLAQRHPMLYSRCFARVTGGPNEREIVEYLLTTLSATGLSREETVLCYRVFADSLLSACGTAASVLALGPDLRDKDANAWSRIYAVLPQEQYPSARAHGAELTGVTEEEIFDTVIEALLDRIEAAVTRRA